MHRLRDFENSFQRRMQVWNPHSLNEDKDTAIQKYVSLQRGFIAGKNEIHSFTNSLENEFQLFEFQQSKTDGEKSHLS